MLRPRLRRSRTRAAPERSRLYLRASAACLVLLCFIFSSDLAAAFSPGAANIPMTGKRYYRMTFSAWLRHAPRCAESHFVFLDAPAPATLDSPAANAPRGAAQILALVTADEAAHIALENDAEVEPLPHPLSRMPISERTAAALAPFGVAPGDDTFTAAEKLARVHPLLKHRVF